MIHTFRQEHPAAMCPFPWAKFRAKLHMQEDEPDEAGNERQRPLPFLNSHALPEKGPLPAVFAKGDERRVEHGLARSLPIQITIIQQLHCGNTLCHYWQKIMFGVWLGSGFGGFFRIQRIPKGVVGPDVRAQRLDAAVL